MSNDVWGNVIGAGIAVAIVSILVSLFNNWKERVLKNERDNYTYPQIAGNFEYWDGYANRFLERNSRLKKSDFDKLSIDEKVQILTDNFGPSKKHNRAASSLRNREQ